MDGVIEDDALFRTIGISETDRDQLRTYQDALGKRPDWLEEWRTVCVTADIKPDNLGFRTETPSQPVMFDFGAARLAPMEEEIMLLFHRIPDDQAIRDFVLSIYLECYNKLADDNITKTDFRQRLPWAELVMYLRSLVEHAGALRWVKWQDRSKELIKIFVGKIGKLISELHKSPCK